MGLMHRACVACGKYRGRMIIDVAKRTLKRAKKGEERAAAKKESEKSEQKEEARS